MATPFVRREPNLSSNPKSAQMAAVWGNRLSERAVRHTRVEAEASIEEVYEFGAKLGQGSFGVVCEATHIDTGKRWAIKAVNKEKAGSSAVKLLEREVAILKLVEHPHIIHLEEVFETAKKMYLVMEICEQGEVADMVKKGVLFSEQETKAIMSQLSQAVSYLHKHDIVHRDLKLENILIKETSTSDDPDRYQIRVTDFGLSVVKGAPGIDNMMEDFCGTPMYMAPEIVDNNPYSHLCDCWALGVIMYTLICGNPPFRSKEEVELYELIKKANVSFTDSVWKKISDSGKNVIKKLLNVNPAHRLTAHELLDHPWITGASGEHHTGNVLEMMREFQKECRIEEKSVEGEAAASSGHGNDEADLVNGKAESSRKLSETSGKKAKATTAPAKSSLVAKSQRVGASPSLRPAAKPTSPKGTSASARGTAPIAHRPPVMSQKAGASKKSK